MEKNWSLQTERLTLREMTERDFGDLCKMLYDPLVMYAYEHAFSEEEARSWLRNQLRRYREDGFGLWAVIRNADGCMIGQCGITWQDWNGRRVPEIGYLFSRAYWHNGYAIEAASACRRYAFERLRFPAVYSIIRENNLPSRRVAERNGMEPCGTMLKHYYGMEMPHIIYGVRNPALK